MFRRGMMTASAVLVAVVLVAAACGGDGGSVGRYPSGELDIPAEQVTPPESAEEQATSPGSTDPTEPVDTTQPVDESGPAGESTAQPDTAGESTAAPDPTDGSTEAPEPMEGSTESAEDAEPPGGAEGSTESAERSDDPTEGSESAEDTEPPVAVEESTEAVEPPDEQDGDSEPPVEPSGDSEPSGDPEPPAEPAADSEPPEPPSAPGMLAFSECGQLYLCATLAVPVDHDDPGGGTIDLAVGMLPAGDPQERIGFLLTNPGGPGGSGLDSLNGGAGLSSYLLDRFDVVGWDPRGVGGSVPANCREETNRLYLLDGIPDSPAERSALDDAAREVADACLAGLGDVAGHIGTVDTVRDMDLIRHGVGAEEISYVGLSYGTLLGALYADMFGEHLRAAVLDGAVDPSLTSLELSVGQMIGFDRTIRDMFDSCRNDPRCPVKGDSREAYEQLRQKVETDPLTDSGGRVLVGPGEAVLAVMMASYISELWPYFFDALAAAERGDGELLQRWAHAFLEIDLGAFISIGCADSGAITRQQLGELGEAMAEVAGDLGLASLTSARPCEYWTPTDGTLRSGPIEAPLAPPIVVLGNRGDNATPYEWAVGLAGQLASGVLVTYDGNGHTSYGKSACVDDIVDAYLVDLAVPPDGRECAAGT